MNKNLSRKITKNLQLGDIVPGSSSLARNAEVELFLVSAIYRVDYKMLKELTYEEFREFI